MALLASMPRMVLLILKTNDLTRNLDETLEHPLGPERTFLILANYCAQVVYEEKLDKSRQWSRYSYRRVRAGVTAWLSYQHRLASLYLFDVVMFFRNIIAWTCLYIINIWNIVEVSSTWPNRKPLQCKEVFRARLHTICRLLLVKAGPRRNSGSGIRRTRSIFWCIARIWCLKEKHNLVAITWKVALLF